MDSAEFIYVPLTISQKCLQSIWHLTLSENEWGGQLFPAIIDNKCQLSCDVPLIEGTGLQKHKEDVYYLGKDAPRAASVRIAVTPLYKEVFQVYPLCDSEHTINMFFHTHPLLSIRDADNLGKFAPPSLGDFFAHTILSNYRNYKQNKQLNTCVLMSFEGMYVYSILPHKFREIFKQIELLFKQLFPNPTRVEAMGYEIGEVPMAVVEKVKMDFFNDLRQPLDSFNYEMNTFLEKHADKTDTTAAPQLQDSVWNCKSCTPPLDFPFFKAIQTPEFQCFIRNNSMVQALHSRGFTYDFFPAPFNSEITFLASSRATFVDKRQL